VTTPVRAPSNPPAAGQGGRVRTPRNTELGLLLFAMAVVLCYAAAVDEGVISRLSVQFWMLPALLTLVFLAAHLVVRFFAPYADPVLLPLVALLNGIGVIFLRRLDLGRSPAGERAGLSPLTGNAFNQLTWTVLTLVGFTVVLVVVRDHKVLSRYAYILGLVGLVLVLIPAVLPGRFSEVNGAKLWIRIGGFQIQPGEFAKLALLCFFATYLVRKREVLSLASRRVLGIDFPRGRDLGPVLIIWAFSLLVLVVEKDLGTSLMYFGMFVVTLYIATERVSWLLIGLLLFFGGAFLAYYLGSLGLGPFLNFHERADIWLDPFADPSGSGYQLVQSLLGLGSGGLFGAGPGAGQPLEVPEVRNDFVFAGIGEEIGLFGLTALLIVYLLVVERGLRAALGVRDSFGKLLAGGLAFTLGLQVFVIVGGVSKLIPLTGQTTPFLSAGGSSLMANWLLVALLLRISDAARQPAEAAKPSAPPTQLAGMATEVIR
jgi:cell division protein FtsW (lipid II flippase)